MSSARIDGAKQMKASDFGRYALFGSVGAALLAGCGGSQPPIGAPGPMPQRPAIGTHVGRSGSWMLPQATSEDLLYISTLGPDVYVYSYPAGKLVGTLNCNFSFTVEECSDTDGNVFITNQARYSAQSGVYEFALFLFFFFFFFFGQLQQRKGPTAGVRADEPRMVRYSGTEDTLRSGLRKKYHARLTPSDSVNRLSRSGFG